MKRIALFGGTFDPIHEGHIHIAKTAADALRLDSVIFIPCQQSPHKAKATGASGEQRLEMLKLATQDLPWASVDSFELDSPDASYSWKTAQAFSKRHPDAKLYWLIGDDQWEKLHTWARIGHLSKLVTFIVHSRHQAENSQSQQPELTAEHLHGTLHPASSSQIRADLANHRPPQWLADDVREYIKKHDLY